MKATFLHQAQLHLPLTTAQGPLDPLAHCLRVACACTIHRAKGKVAKISYFMAQFVRWCTPLSEGKESIPQNTWQGLWSIYLACKTCTWEGGQRKPAHFFFHSIFGPQKRDKNTDFDPLFFWQKHWVKFAYVRKNCTAIQKLVAIKASVTCARHSRQNCR